MCIQISQCCLLTNGRHKKINFGLQMFCVLSDGYAYYEEWQHLVQKSDQQVKELLESYGTKCKNLGVCENFSSNFSRHLPSNYLNI